MLPMQGGREGTCVPVCYRLPAFAVVAMLPRQGGREGTSVPVCYGLPASAVCRRVACLVGTVRVFGLMRFVCNHASESRGWEYQPMPPTHPSRFSFGSHICHGAMCMSNLLVRVAPFPIVVGLSLGARNIVPLLTRLRSFFL